MRLKNPFWLLIIGWLLLGCSKDDNPSDLESAPKISDFMAIGEDLENIFLYKYNASQEQGETINLTEENLVNRQYLTLRQVADLLTFFSFSSGSFSAIQRNLITGESQSLDNFYTVSQERSLLWGTNSENQLFLGFFSPSGSTDFGIRTIDLTTNEETELMVESNLQNVYDPIYFRERLLVVYLDVGNNYHTAIMDTENNTILNTLDFGNSIPSILINKMGDIVIFQGNNDANYRYTVYDIETFEIVEEDTFSINRFFDPGPLQAYFINEKLYYLNFYSQPSSVPFGPAVYEFNSKQNRILDMLSIVMQVEQEMQINIDLTAFGYDLSSSSFLMGYANSSDSNILEGGVLIISDQGALLDNIELNFVPTYFIKQ